MKTFILSLISSLCTAAAAHTVTLRAEPQILQESVVLVGPVEPLRSATVQVSFPTMIKSLAVKLGQKVKAGQLIAEVDPGYLEFQLAYAKGRERLLESQLSIATNDEEISHRQQERLGQLASRNIVSEVDVDSAKLKTLYAASGRFQAERALTETKASRSWLESQIAERNLLAPMDGIITELAINPAQVVGAFQASPERPVARIDELGRYLIHALAVDTQVVGLKVGQPLMIFFDGYSKPLKGSLVSVIRRSEIAKDRLSLFEVTAEFDSHDEPLRRGLMARIEIPVGEARKVLSVPWNAVRLTASRAALLVGDEKGVFLEREIELGMRTRHRVEVTRGLTAGESYQATLWK